MWVLLLRRTRVPLQSLSTILTLNVFFQSFPSSHGLSDRCADPLGGSRAQGLKTSTERTHGLWHFCYVPATQHSPSLSVLVSCKFTNRTDSCHFLKIETKTLKETVQRINCRSPHITVYYSTAPAPRIEAMRSMRSVRALCARDKVKGAPFKDTTV